MDTGEAEEEAVVATVSMQHDDDGLDYLDYDDDPDCSRCGGRPDEQECDDPIQCCDPRCDGTWHPCVACQGTGLARFQVIW